MTNSTTKRLSVRERAALAIENVPETAFDPADDRKRQTLGPTSRLREYVESTPIKYVRKEPVANLRLRPGYERDESEYVGPEFDALKASIQEEGINVTPIDVREVITPNDSYFEVLAGERRTRALQASGLSDALVAVRDCDDRTADRIHELENRHRAAKAAYSRALQYRRMLDSAAYASQTELAESIRVNKSELSRLLSLLDSAPKGMWERVTDPARISMDDAKVLLRAYPKEGFMRVVRGKSQWTSKDLVAAARSSLRRQVAAEDRVLERKRGKHYFIQLPLAVSAADRAKVLDLIKGFFGGKG